MPAAAAAALLALALALAPVTAAAAHTMRSDPAANPTPNPTAGAAGAAGDNEAGAAAADPTCPDVEFMGARGSGEDNNVPTKTRYTAQNPTFGMGGVIADLYRRVDSSAKASGVTMQPYGVPYPAVGIDVVGGDALVSGEMDTYSKSVELGAHAISSELDRVSRACPNTQVVVAGYSQGAQAAVEGVLGATPNGRKTLVAAVFFGNTYFDSSDTSDDYGGYSPGLDGYLVHSGTAPASATTRGPGWASKFDDVPVFDYCRAGDPICGLVRSRTIDGVDYQVRDFAHIVSTSADAQGDPSILTHHTEYQRGETANAAQQLRFALGLPLDQAPALNATITSPGTTETGVDTRFNGGGSLSDPADPIVSYRWGIDPDTDSAHWITKVTPLMSTAFFAAGRHTVSLQVTTLSGKSAQASVTLNAVAAPTAAPAAPVKVQATAGDGAVGLDWPAVKGADFYAVTDASGELLTAFTPLIPTQQTVSWTDTGLRNGKERDYRVYAVNGIGRSPASKKVTATPQHVSAHRVSAPVRLPLPATTLVDPELAWSMGLGLMVVVLALALVKGGRRLRR